MSARAPIRYFAPHQPYFEFSNFSPHAFTLQGESWPTVEHYFQAQKFPANAYQETIRCAGSPEEAKALGQTREHRLRPDWDEIKEEVMLCALRAKFRDARLAALLLSTQDRDLIEDAEDDSYWAQARSGFGLNRAGVLLMQVREEIQQQRSCC